MLRVYIYIYVESSVISSERKIEKKKEIIMLIDYILGQGKYFPETTHQESDFV